MSSFCIYERVVQLSRYEPPEAECEIDDDHDCENCLMRMSKEDFDLNKADMEYESDEGFFDFL